MDYFHYQRGELYCEDVPVAQLAEKFGTPLWVYSKRTMLLHLERLQEAFAEADPLICYSVKANGNLAILQTMHEAGAGFDVVSGGELHRVLAAGGDPGKTVFAGVGKTDDEIRFALRACRGLPEGLAPTRRGHASLRPRHPTLLSPPAGGEEWGAGGVMMFNVESEQELEAIAAVAEELDAEARIALRLNPDVDPHTHAKTTTGKRGTKFGLDPERARALAAKAERLPSLDLCGIHIHLGSPILSAEPYAEAVQLGIQFIRELRAAGHLIDWLNLGGGFGIHYRKQEALPATAFAEVIVPALRRQGVRLALEPGRFIVGNAGILVSRVIFTKLSGGKHFVVQDAGMNDLVRPAMYDAFHRIWPVVAGQPVPEDCEAAAPGTQATDVVGPVCETGDFLARDRGLPPIERGDLLATFSAGAYGMAMSSNYNARPRGAEVLVDGEHYQLVRRRETYDDLVAAEVEPELQPCTPQDR